MKERGATLVEVLVAIALTGIMLPTLATALVTSHAGRATSQQQLKATALLNEASEALRVVRDTGWSNVATDGTYHPAISGSTWVLASGPETAGGFTRQITISAAERNGSGSLVQSGGTADPSTKRATIEVSWSEPYAGSVSDDLYLSRWQGNTTWNQTVTGDFSAGTTTNTVVTNTAGGEVELDGAPTYQTSGTFESSTFDAGASAGFNYLAFTVNKPSGTDIKFQIAINTDSSTWSYIGPDGTGSTYFTAAAGIPLGTAEGRYFRYKAFLSSDGTATPTLYDITVSYSP